MKLAAKLVTGVLVAGAAALVPASPAQAAPGNCSSGYVTPTVTTTWAICTTGTGTYRALATCSNNTAVGGPSKSVGSYSYAKCATGARAVWHGISTSG